MQLATSRHPLLMLLDRLKIRNRSLENDEEIGKTEPSSLCLQYDEEILSHAIVIDYLDERDSLQPYNLKETKQSTQANSIKR